MFGNLSKSFTSITKAISAPVKSMVSRVSPKRILRPFKRTLKGFRSTGRGLFKHATRFTRLDPLGLNKYLGRIPMVGKYASAMTQLPAYALSRTASALGLSQKARGYTSYRNSYPGSFATGPAVRGYDYGSQAGVSPGSRDPSYPYRSQNRNKRLSQHKLLAIGAAVVGGLVLLIVLLTRRPSSRPSTVTYVPNAPNPNVSRTPFGGE